MKKTRLTREIKRVNSNVYRITKTLSFRDTSISIEKYYDDQGKEINYGEALFSINKMK